MNKIVSTNERKRQVNGHIFVLGEFSQLRLVGEN